MQRVELGDGIARFEPAHAERRAPPPPRLRRLRQGRAVLGPGARAGARARQRRAWATACARTRSCSTAPAATAARAEPAVANRRRSAYSLESERGLQPQWAVTSRSPPTPAPPCSAPRVRQLRKARGLTLKAARLRDWALTRIPLAARARSERVRACRALDDIAAALGISAAALVSNTPSGVRPPGPPLQGMRTVVPHGRRAESDQVIRALTSGDALMKVTESTGTFPSTRSAWPTLAKRWSMSIDGSDRDRGRRSRSSCLGAGDVLNFDCSLEHTYRRRRRHPATLPRDRCRPGPVREPGRRDAIYEHRASRTARTVTALERDRRRPDDESAMSRARAVEQPLVGGTGRSPESAPAFLARRSTKNPKPIAAATRSTLSCGTPESAGAR